MSLFSDWSDNEKMDNWDFCDENEGIVPLEAANLHAK
jgi:hypothetical protein